MAWNLSIRNPFVLQKDKDGNFLYLSGSSRYVQDTRTVYGQISAYKYCAPLAGIIQRKSKALNNGKVFLMDSDNKVSTVAYAKAMMKLMDRPNIMQSWTEFMSQLYTYFEIFGEAFVFAVSPVGFENDKSKVKSLWVIPNWIIQVFETQKIFFQSDITEIIEKYQITANGKTTDIAPGQIIHFKDSIVNTDFILRGESKLVALQDPISNIVAAYEARNVLIVKKGALGILSNNSKDAAGAIPLKDPEKKELQSDFQKYGLGKDQYQVIITSASLQWQSMTFPTKELMLFEEIEDDVRQIADTLEYPVYLLGFKAGTTFSNVKEAKASLYQDAIIPDAEAIYSQFSKYFETEKYGFSFKVFYDHLDILQKSEKDKAEALKLRVQAFDIGWKGKAITLEEYRKLAYDLDETIPKGTMYDGKPDSQITVN